MFLLRRRVHCARARARTCVCVCVCVCFQQKKEKRRWAREIQIDERGCDGNADVSLEETFISSSNDDSHSRVEKVSLHICISTVHYDSTLRWPTCLLDHSMQIEKASSHPSSISRTSPHDRRWKSFDEDRHRLHRIISYCKNEHLDEWMSDEYLFVYSTKMSINSVILI